MKKVVVLLLSFVFMLHSNSCKKDKGDGGPNDLGGSTDIPLTVVGNESSIYISIGNYNLPTGTMTVLSNVGGIVTYKVILDLTGSPDSATIAALVPAQYKDAQGRINTEMKFKITSEGIQDFFTSNKPWTIVEYNDPVATQYKITTENGDELVRTVTEKTGQDDWQMGFMYIKTSKVEQPLPADDEVATKITYRANHKFGLVYIQLDLKNGQTLKCDVYPWFLL